MSKGNIIIIVVSILLVVLLAGAAVTWFGDGENPFEDIFTPDDPVEEGPVVLPETQYNATFGTNFKEDFPIDKLPLRDSMPVAPYIFQRDITLKMIARVNYRKDISL